MTAGRIAHDSHTESQTRAEAEGSSLDLDRTTTLECAEIGLGTSYWLSRGAQCTRRKTKTKSHLFRATSASVLSSKNKNVGFASGLPNITTGSSSTSCKMHQNAITSPHLSDSKLSLSFPAKRCYRSRIPRGTDGEIEAGLGSRVAVSTTCEARRVKRSSSFRGGSDSTTEDQFGFSCLQVPGWRLNRAGALRRHQPDAWQGDPLCKAIQKLSGGARVAGLLNV